MYFWRTFEINVCGAGRKCCNFSLESKNSNFTHGLKGGQPFVISYKDNYEEANLI